MEHFRCVPRVEQIVRDLCRTDKRCRGPNPRKHVDKSLILIMDTDFKKYNKDKGKKKLSVGLRLILRPHTDESGSAGKKKKRHFISPKQQNGSPSHWKPTPSFGVRPQKLNDWWRPCHIKTASLANTLKQLLCHVGNREGHVLVVYVLDKHALCSSRPSNWCVQTNTPGLRHKGSTLHLFFMVRVQAKNSP